MLLNLQGVYLLVVVHCCTDERPVSVTEESLISFENDEHVEHTPGKVDNLCKYIQHK